MSSQSVVRSFLPPLAFTLFLLLGACAPAAQENPVPTPTAVAVVTEEPASLVEVTEIAPLPPEEATMPTELQLPALDLTLPVVPMEWTIATVDGERTTKWIVPDAAVGWHVNSAGAGAAGTTLLSAHQAQGDALFKPLALGEVEVGQEVLLVDEDGVAFVYRITALSDPLPVSNPSEAEAKAVQDLIAPALDGRLVLITGWPDFTTTHRVFASADYVGVAQ